MKIATHLSQTNGGLCVLISQNTSTGIGLFVLSDFAMQFSGVPRAAM